MTTRAPRPAASSGGKPAASADSERSRPDPIAVSPAFGPVPPIYVPRTRAEAAAASPLWRLAVRAARSGWLRRRPPERTG
jgi:hypothetical protein